MTWLSIPSTPFAGLEVIRITLSFLKDLMMFSSVCISTGIDSDPPLAPVSRSISHNWHYSHSLFVPILQFHRTLET